MQSKLSPVRVALVLLAALWLIAWAGSPPHASAGQPSNSASTPPKVVTVVIREFKFEPAAVTVRAGDTVEWKNEDVVPHTATADVVAYKHGFDSGTILTGATWRYVAQMKGTYNYICMLHPNMKGKLIVQ